MMPVRVAVVGYGAAGRQHVEALCDLPEAELACVFEANPEVDVGELPRAASWAALLDDPLIDAVALCLQPGGRAALACQALEAGKAVLLEKPPCINEAELDLLEKAAKNAQQTMGVMLQHRYRLPEEVLAWPCDARTTAVLEVSRPRNKAHFLKAAWRQDLHQACGGVTAHLGVHYLDLACMILGEPATLRVAARRDLFAGIDVRLTGTVEFTSGAALTLAVTSESELRSERLTILSPDRRFTIEDGVVRVEQGGQVKQYAAVATAQLRRALYQDFATAVMRRAKPERCHLHGSRWVTRLLEWVASQAVAGS